MEANSLVKGKSKNNFSPKNLWQAIRPWFYSIWLVYELSIRFYEYSSAFQEYIVASFSGQFIDPNSQILFWAGVIINVITFLTCSFYLTLPTSILLFNYLGKKDNATSLLKKIKIYM